MDTLLYNPMEYTHYTVAVGLLLGNRVYLSKRLNTPNFPNKWQFAGGKLEQGEDAMMGCIREVKEETGIDLSTDRLVYVHNIHGDPTIYCCYLYYVVLRRDEVPMLTEYSKMTEWRLFTYDLASKLDLMPGLEEVIGWLQPKYEVLPELLPLKI